MSSRVLLRCDEVVAAMERIAPLSLAESWDNVGLLVEPSWAADKREQVATVLLTNDLTERVVREARERQAQFIVAYHPPIFAALKRLTGADAKQRIVRDCLEHGIAVYSPHTACDAADGGVNDWLVRCLALGSGAAAAHDALAAAVHTCEPLQSAAAGRADQLKLAVFVPREHAATVRERLSEAGAGNIGAYSHCSFETAGTGTFLGDADASCPQRGAAGRLERVDELRLEMVCPRARLAAVAQAISRHHPYEEPAWDAYPLEPLPLLCGDRPAALPDRAAALPQRRCGAGRRAVLAAPATLRQLVDRLKRAVGVATVRVAVADQRSADAPDCRTVAVGAGAAGSLLLPVAGKVDVLLSGEMSHHDVLAACARGSHVVLLEHSNSERGYLRDVLQPCLAQQLAHRCQVIIAERDVEPFTFF